MPHLPFRSRVAVPALVAIAALAIIRPQPARAQISFYTAVDLALRNSHEVKMAAADVDRAAAALTQTRDAYVPTGSIGSSLGYSYGFPVGQPTVVNATANSLVLSFSQPSIDPRRACLTRRGECLPARHAPKSRRGHRPRLHRAGHRPPRTRSTRPAAQLRRAPD